MHARTALVAAAILAATLTACSGNHKQPAADTSTSSSKLKAPAAQTKAVSVRLAWSRTAKDGGGDTEVSYVARVQNPGKSPASVAIDVRALDETGTIVGSSQETLPNVPAGATFDFFGNLGGGFSASLTGTPAKLQISQNKDAFGQAGAVDSPMLASSELKLSSGSRDDLYTDANAPYAYNLAVKVTNSTHDAVANGVVQQVVLYDAKGNVVGGDTGSSDNAPDNLPAGMSYREQWTGIPAAAKAVRAAYTVWQG
ncbi:hypothetical protein LXH13_06210 [Streptomyces spinosirectus]|jgi:hypothetical protein|uniref:hypothetical protein n=1 Tax=Streptomyces TaxID=1883 RepID=UPI001C9D9912|nr:MULTISPECIES: hypothetical protein [Streptomyces]MBY8341999.1 hypothetical protein [Streptomyces plumbidurans]UIR16652.1 hypothetical protein LXH13_06210 [Streptomyces spinosirectus]